MAITTPVPMLVPASPGDETWRLTPSQEKAALGIHQGMADLAKRWRRHGSTRAPQDGPVPLARVWQQARVRPPKEFTVFLIDGDRGTGKTSLMLWLIERWQAQQEALRVTRSTPAERTGTSAAEAEVLAALENVVPVPVPIVDFAALHDSAEPISALVGSLAGIVEALEATSSDPDGPEAAAWRNPRRSTLGERWRQLEMTAAAFSQPARNSSAAAADREVFARDNATDAREWLALSERFSDVVDEILVQVDRQFVREATSFLVIPIDDADLAVRHSAALPQIFRVMHHNRVLFLLTGNLDVLHAAIHAAPGARTLDRASRGLAGMQGRTNGFVWDVIERAIPGNHRFYLDKLPSFSRMEQAVQMTIGGGPLQRTLRETIDRIDPPAAGADAVPLSSLLAVPSMVPGNADAHLLYPHLIPDRLRRLATLVAEFSRLAADLDAEADARPADRLGRAAGPFLDPLWERTLFKLGPPGDVLAQSYVDVFATRQGSGDIGPAVNWSTLAVLPAYRRWGSFGISDAMSLTALEGWRLRGYPNRLSVPQEELIAEYAMLASDVTVEVRKRRGEVLNPPLEIPAVTFLEWRSETGSFSFALPRWTQFRTHALFALYWRRFLECRGRRTAGLYVDRMIDAVMTFAAAASGVVLPRSADSDEVRPEELARTFLRDDESDAGKAAPGVSRSLEEAARPMTEPVVKPVSGERLLERLARVIAEHRNTRLPLSNEISALTRWLRQEAALLVAPEIGLSDAALARWAFLVRAAPDGERAVAWYEGLRERQQKLRAALPVVGSIDLPTGHPWRIVQNVVRRSWLDVQIEWPASSQRLKFRPKTARAYVDIILRVRPDAHAELDEAKFGFTVMSPAPADSVVAALSRAFPWPHEVTPERREFRLTAPRRSGTVRYGIPRSSPEVALGAWVARSAVEDAAGVSTSTPAVGWSGVLGRDGRLDDVEVPVWPAPRFQAPVDMLLLENWWERNIVDRARAPKLGDLAARYIKAAAKLIRQRPFEGLLSIRAEDFGVTLSEVFQSTSKEDESRDEGFVPRWTLFQRWREDVVLMAAPEAGLPPVMAAQILEHIGRPDVTALPSRKILEDRRLSWVDSVQRRAILDRAKKSAPDHPWFGPWKPGNTLP